MTLVEAIARCEQMAAACDDEQRTEGYQQLHAWLFELSLRRKEVRRLKEQTSLLNSMRGEWQERAAALMELVTEIWESCPVDERDCFRCPHHRADAPEDKWCELLDRMRELLDRMREMGIGE